MPDAVKRAAVGEIVSRILSIGMAGPDGGVPAGLLFFSRSIRSPTITTPARCAHRTAFEFRQAGMQLKTKVAGHPCLYSHVGSRATLCKR